MAAAPRRRKNQASLSHLHLAPLSSGPTSTSQGYPLSPNDKNELPSTNTPRSSYIAGRSAPTTPGILSRASSPKRTRQHRLGDTGASSKSYTHLAFADTVDAGLRRAASAKFNGLTQQGNATTSKQKKRATRSKGAGDGGEWMHRAGTAITSEARESKGQSWLVSRASSTSLLAQAGAEDDDYERKDEGYGGKRSHNTSRAHSARTSRRASRVGSRADLAAMTPVSRITSKSSLDDEDSGYFGGREQRTGAARLAGPDFVNGFDDDDEDEDDDEDVREAKRLDEEVVARLTKERGFGMGGLVDRLVGWTLFPEPDLGERTGAGGDHEIEADVLDRSHKQRSASAALTEREDKERLENTAHRSSDVVHGDEGSGWNDAAWLLSVASKVLF